MCRALIACIAEMGEGRRVWGRRVYFASEPVLGATNDGASAGSEPVNALLNIRIDHERSGSQWLLAESCWGRFISAESVAHGLER